MLRDVITCHLHDCHLHNSKIQHVCQLYQVSHCLGTSALNHHVNTYSMKHLASVVVYSKQPLKELIFIRVLVHSMHRIWPCFGCVAYLYIKPHKNQICNNLY